MPDADVPPAQTGLASLVRKRPRAAFLLLFLLAGILFHRPALNFLLNRALQMAASGNGLVLTTRLSGSLLTRCVFEDLNIVPRKGAPASVKKLFVHRMTVEYSLARLLFRGPDRFLNAVTAQGVDLHLSTHHAALPRDESPSRMLARGLKALLESPLFWTESIHLSDLQITGTDPENGFLLRGGTLTAGPSKSGVLAVESLRLSGDGKPEAISATTTYSNHHLILHGLKISPSLELSRVELDTSKRSLGLARLELEGMYGGGRLFARFEASPLDLQFQAEASGIRGKELAGAFSEKTARWPDLVSANVALTGDPNRPISWSGGVRIECGKKLGTGADGALLLETSLREGILEWKHLDGRTAASQFACSGKMQLPGTWEGFSQMEGTAQCEFESSSLKEWLALSGVKQLDGRVRGNATARLSRGRIQADFQVEGDSLHAGLFQAGHCRIAASVAAPCGKLPPLGSIAGNAVLSCTRPGFSNERVSMTLEEGACAVALEGGTARFWNLVMKDTANVFAGEFSVPLTASAGPATGSLRLNAGDLSVAGARVLGHPVGGALEAVFTGTLEANRLSGRGSASGRALSWGGFSLGKFFAEATAKDGEMQLEKGAFEWSTSEALRASGTASFGTGAAYDLKLEAMLPNLERISPLLEQLGWAKSKVSGALEGRWAGSGSLETRSGSGDWNVRIRQAQWEAVKLESFECSGRYVPGRLSVAPLRFSTKATKFSARIDWRPGAMGCHQLALEQWGHPVLSGEFVLPLAFDKRGLHWVEDAEISGGLHAEKLDLGTLLTFNGTPSPVQGWLQFALTLGGNPADPTADLRCSATGLRPTEAPRFGNSTLTVEGRYARGALSASATAATPMREPIHMNTLLPLPLADLFSGKVKLGSLPVEAGIQASNLNLSPLPTLWSGLRKIEGSASVDVKLKGPAQDPVWQGSLKMGCPVLHFASDRLPAIGGLSLGAEFSQKEARLTRLKADLGGGALDVEGSAKFTDPRNPSLDFKAKAHEVLAVRNSKLALRLNGELALKGTLRTATISGAVSPTKSRVQRDIDVLPLNVLRMAIPAETRTAGKPWFTFRKAPFSDWRFNVDIRTRPGDPFLVRGNRLRGSMDAEIRLEGSGSAPTLHGAYRSSDLNASLPFARVELSRGRIWYTRDNPFLPNIDFSAETEVRNHRIRLYVHGPAGAPHISASSEPPEPETDLLTLITTGALPGDSSETSQALANRAATVLFQEFSSKVLPSGDRERFSALRRFNLELSALNNRTGQQETRLTYRVQDNLFMIGEVGNAGDYAGRVRYLLRFR